MLLFSLLKYNVHKEYLQINRRACLSQIALESHTVTKYIGTSKFNPLFLKKKKIPTMNNADALLLLSLNIMSRE